MKVKFIGAVEQWQVQKILIESNGFVNRLWTFQELNPRTQLGTIAYPSFNNWFCSDTHGHLDCGYCQD
jgi:hypothetical protein